MERFLRVTVAYSPYLYYQGEMFLYGTQFSVCEITSLVTSIFASLRLLHGRIHSRIVFLEAPVCYLFVLAFSVTGGS